MKVLGIETSCDETAVCLIEVEGDFGANFTFDVLGNALISQAALHAKYGGVFPNLAKREHAKNLVPVLTEALSQEKMAQEGTTNEPPQLKELLVRESELYKQLSEFLETHGKPHIDAIAVTHGPGLEPALWVGINFAKALSLAWDIPIVAVNHMEGHIVLPMMEMTKLEHSHILQNMRVFGRLKKFEFPVLALLISGGHTELVFSKQFGTYQIIGQTRDDAVGEAFDKVARLLGLGYPGGPEISRLAKEARQKSMRADFSFPRPMLHEDNFDFSFSGLKTAVRKIVESYTELTDDDRRKIAREFEDAATDVLVQKTLRAIDVYGAATVIVGGGVSANMNIREQLAKALEKTGDASLLIPTPELATDNALMIAFAGYFHALRSEFADPSILTAVGNLRLA